MEKKEIEEEDDDDKNAWVEIDADVHSDQEAECWVTSTLGTQTGPYDWMFIQHMLYRQWIMTLSDCSVKGTSSGNLPITSITLIKNKQVI